MAGILLGVLGSKIYNVSKENTSKKPEVSSDSLPDTLKTGVSVKEPEAEIPSKVYDILKYVETFHEPKQGYAGGRVFHNYEGLLPKRNTAGNKIKYREWDVNPKNGVLKRGKERLVTGDDKSAWYTKDHYKSFIKIR